MDGQPDGNDPTANTPKDPGTSSPIKPTVEQAEVTSQPTKITTHQDNPTTELRREFKLFEILSLIFNGLLVFVGIGAICVYNGQLNVMKGTLGEMRRSGAQSTDQVWRAIDNINWLARSMDGSLQQAQRSLKASIEISRNDQRAWVGVSGFEKTVVEVNKPFRIRFHVKNSGRTPARIRAAAVIDPVKMGAAPDFRNIKQPESHGIIPPNDEFVMDLDGTKDSPTGLSKKGRDAIISGEQVIYVYGVICYSDVFDRPHWTLFCEVLNRKTIDFDLCDFHNDMDRDEPNQQRKQPDRCKE